MTEAEYKALISLLFSGDAGLATGTYDPFALEQAGAAPPPQIVQAYQNSGSPVLQQVANALFSGEWDPVQAYNYIVQEAPNDASLASRTPEDLKGVVDSIFGDVINYREADAKAQANSPWAKAGLPNPAEKYYATVKDDGTIDTNLTQDVLPQKLLDRIARVEDANKYWGGQLRIADRAAKRAGMRYLNDTLFLENRDKAAYWLDTAATAAADEAQKVRPEGGLLPRWALRRYVGQMRRPAGVEGGGWLTTLSRDQIVEALTSSYESDGGKKTAPYKRADAERLADIILQNGAPKPSEVNFADFPNLVKDPGFMSAYQEPRQESLDRFNSTKRQKEYNDGRMVGQALMMDRLGQSPFRDALMRKMMSMQAGGLG